MVQARRRVKKIGENKQLPMGPKHLFLRQLHLFFFGIVCVVFDEKCAFQDEWTSVSLATHQKCFHPPSLICSLIVWCGGGSSCIFECGAKTRVLAFISVEITHKCRAINTNNCSCSEQSKNFPYWWNKLVNDPRPHMVGQLVWFICNKVGRELATLSKFSLRCACT